MWQKGPLPKDTYGWGGVVPVWAKGTGFHFADFKGDHVKIVPSGRTVQPEEVLMYDNSLTLPPGQYHGEEQSKPASEQQ